MDQTQPNYNEALSALRQFFGKAHQWNLSQLNGELRKSKRKITDGPDYVTASN